MNNLKIYDFLSNEKKEITNKKTPIKIFNCGPTVSDYIHVGHLRNALLVDQLQRILKGLGYTNVLYISNVSNISQKIYNRSVKELGGKWEKMGDYFTEQWLKDLSSMGLSIPYIIMPDTNHIEHIIFYVSELIKKGVAYETNDGILYDINFLHKVVRSRGKSTPLNDAITENVEDFILWEKVYDKKDTMTWDSPWGIGRPGKHIPCSDVIDMFCTEKDYIFHCAGNDLYYHHSCEIAQNSFGTRESKISDVWTYNALVTINNQKMGKSLGNGVVVRELLKVYAPDVIRWYLLTKPFDREICFSVSDLEHAANTYTKIENCIRLKSSSSYDVDVYGFLMDMLANNLNVSGVLKYIKDNILSVNTNGEVLQTFYYIMKMLGFGITKKGE